MPNPIIPVPKFPNVAQLPGVPQLIRANQAIGTVQLAVGAVQKFLGSASQNGVWGIFNVAGQPVVTPDNFLDFENSNDWRISDFPLQDGLFSAYNKVMLPRALSLKMTKGGSLQDRTALLLQIAAIAGDTKLYNVIVPEGIYLGFNVTRYAIRRQGREGAYYFADLEIFFRSVPQTTSQYSTTSANTANAKNATAIPAQNLGTQSPQLTVPPAVRSIVNTAVANTPH